MCKLNVFCNVCCIWCVFLFLSVCFTIYSMHSNLKQNIEVFAKENAFDNFVYQNRPFSSSLNMLTMNNVAGNTTVNFFHALNAGSCPLTTPWHAVYPVWVRKLGMFSQSKEGTMLISMLVNRNFQTQLLTGRQHSRHASQSTAMSEISMRLFLG